MARPIRRCLPLVTVLGGLMTLTQSGFGVEGDSARLSELLRRAAADHLAVYESIQTWQGSARAESTRRVKDRPYSVSKVRETRDAVSELFKDGAVFWEQVYVIEFVLDADQDQLFSDFRSDGPAVYRSGDNANRVAVTATSPFHRKAVLTAYDYFYSHPHEQRPVPVADVLVEPTRLRGAVHRESPERVRQEREHRSVFDPRRMLEFNGGETSEYLNSIAKFIDDGRVKATLDERPGPHSIYVFRWRNKGGDQKAIKLVSVGSRLLLAESVCDLKFDNAQYRDRWTYREHSGTVLPVTWMHAVRHGEELDRSRTITLSDDSRINEPVARSTFTHTALGAGDGDFFLYDDRETEYRFLNGVPVEASEYRASLPAVTEDAAEN